VPLEHGHRARGLAPIIGALTAGRRPGDQLIRAGFAGAVVFALLKLWSASLEEERKLRAEQHKELVGVIDKLADRSEQERIAALELRGEILRLAGSKLAPSRSVPPHRAVPAPGRAASLPPMQEVR